MYLIIKLDQLYCLIVTSVVLTRELILLSVIALVSACMSTLQALSVTLSFVSDIAVVFFMSVNLPRSMWHVYVCVLLWQLLQRTSELQLITCDQFKFRRALFFICTTMFYFPMTMPTICLPAVAAAQCRALHCSIQQFCKSHRIVNDLKPYSAALCERMQVKMSAALGSVTSLCGKPVQDRLMQY